MSAYHTREVYLPLLWLSAASTYHLAGLWNPENFDNAAKNTTRDVYLPHSAMSTYHLRDVYLPHRASSTYHLAAAYPQTGR